MLFSSNVFLFAFLPVVLVIYYISPRALKNPILLLASLFFYGWGEPVYLILMVFTIGLNYLCGLLIHHFRTCKDAKSKVLITGVGTNLLLLAFFKYFGFFATQLQRILPFLRDWDVPKIPLPIGISFYIFQSMSYIIDVLREDTVVQKNLLTFGTYVALFPQLIAGPIVRYRDVAQQLENRKENLADFASGVMLFVVGLSKKILLANPMGTLWNLLQAQPGTLCAWVGICAYSLQIYFDFSGYSDMARGLGRMLGFEFLENFNYPYISRSVTEFWRRWHISLSTWFREYVYIPLGGNRLGLRRQIINLFVVWSLTGLWHGASWNFVLWGQYYALLLIFEKTFLLKKLEKLPAFIGHSYTILAFVLGWSLFFFEDMTALQQFLHRLCILETSHPHGITVILSYIPLMVAAVLASTPIVKRLYCAYQDIAVIRYARILGTVGLLLLCTAVLVSQSYNPFIYFRF